MNIRELRESKGLMQKELARMVGVSPSTFNQYETGKRQPDISTLQLIARALDVTIDELVDCETMIPKSTGGVWIPVLGKISAGVPLEAIEDILDYEEISAKDFNFTFDYFGLRVDGDSMEPEYRDGDVIVVRKQDTAETGEDAVIIVNGNDATFKRIRRDERGITIVPLNSAKYTPWYYTNEQIESLPVKVIGIAVEVRRKIR